MPDLKRRFKDLIPFFRRPSHRQTESREPSEFVCHVCISMFESPELRGRHHATFAGLEMAAGRNCSYCVSMHRRFRSYDQARKCSFNYEFNSENNVLIISSEGIGVDLHTFHIITIKDKSELVGNLKNEKSLTAASTGDEAVIALAREWLATCLAEHGCGAQLVGNRWYPKRLLDVRNGRVRLAITDLDKPSGSYATLSHCWGAKLTFMRLTTSNIRSLRENIQLSKLPQTFCDSIDITRRLGLDYVWIDSLCILQKGDGSREDWLEHAKVMADIYRNCVVNIAAHKAESPMDGCYTNRDPRLIGKHLVRLHKNTDFPEAMYQIFPWDICGHRGLQTSRLSTRAWVFQERLLSPRVLHFTAEQIIWECGATPLACECCPDGIPAHIPGYYGQRVFNVSSNPVTERRAADGHSTQGRDRDSWCNILQEYNSCDLTKPDEDKLVALAGIAKQMSELRRDQYVAGFYLSEILFALPWRAGKSRSGGGRRGIRASTQYRAPSWSWASMDGPLSFVIKHSGRELLAHVENVDITLVDPKNPWGAIKAGSIVLSGWLFPFKMRGTNRRHSFGYENCVLQGLGVNFHTEFDAIDNGLTRHKWVDTDQIFALPILRDQKLSNQENDYTWGLAIRKLENGTGYERVGSISVLGPWPLDTGKFEQNIRIY